MEVQCFEMWGKVKLEKLQNDPNLVSHSSLFLCWWKSFPMSLSLLSMLTWTLTRIQTNVCTGKQTNKRTNKQTDKDVWAFKTRTLNHLISQNVHHINYNKGNKKLSGRGLICIDFHAYCHRDLWFHQCSLISMIWAQYRVDDPGRWPPWTTQVPAPPPGTASSCCWWADQLRTKDMTPHKRTCSLWTLHDHCWHCKHGVHFAAFQLRPYPIFRNSALSLIE